MSALTRQSIAAGIIMVFAGWMLIGLTFYCVDKAYKGECRKTYRTIAAFAGLFGVALMIHGLFLACTGTLWPFSNPRFPEIAHERWWKSVQTETKSTY